MYNGFYKTSPFLSIMTVLFVLMVSAAEADNYQPMHGSFRPPSLGGTSAKQSGFRQDNSPHITTPSQQQAWTSQPYAGSPNYYLPTPQPAPAYQQQNTQNDPWNRSISVNPGNVMNNMFGFRNDHSSNPPATVYQPPAYQPSIPQPPAYQPSIPQAPVYQQPYYYGSSYPLQYGYTSQQTPQPPVATPSNTPPARSPAPFTGSRRPFGGKGTRFRPPELKGTD